MNHSVREFENMKQEAIGLRKEVEAFLRLTDYRESETFAGIWHYVDSLGLGERNRSSDVQALQFIGLIRKYLESQNDTLYALQRQFDVHSREQNRLVRAIYENTGKLALEMSRVGIRFAIERTRQKVQKRLEMGPLLPIGQETKN